MLKKIIFFMLLLLPASHVFCQPFNCSAFREGRFRTADSRVGAIVITERNSMYQTESTETLKLSIRFSISWQDNCSYTLTLDKVIRNENKVDIPSNLTVTVKIIETTSQTYIEEITSSMANGSYRAEVKRL